MINIVLYEPEIPGNTGNIMRTCAATKVKLHLIEPLGFSLNEKYLKRSGVNYLEFCDYTVYEDFDDFKNKNKGVYFLFTRYSNKIYTDIKYEDIKENIYLIFGKESTGIPKSILKEYKENCLRIPMSENVRALNISNSVAVGLYEVLRHKDFENLLTYDHFKGIDYLDK